MKLIKILFLVLALTCSARAANFNNFATTNTDPVLRSIINQFLTNSAVFTSNGIVIWVNSGFSAYGAAILNEVSANYQPLITSLLAVPEITTSNLLNRAKGSWWANGGTNIQWRLAKNITLTNVTDVSACSYNPLTHTFWTIHNNNAGRITEWNLQGENIRVINGTGAQCPDGEAIVWMGGERYAISDEDSGRIFILSITNNASGSSWSTNNCQIIQLSSTIGNDVNSGSGAEGIAWDQDRNGWWVAREKAPAQLLFVSADGSTTNNYFTTAQMQTFTNSTHTDFSDLYLDRENQLLWVSQDEGGTQTDRVLAISLITSNVVHTINMTNFGQLEGVSVTPDGLLLVAGEVNQFAIYEPYLGGLNSGIKYNRNTSTNLPDTLQFPFGATVGVNGAGTFSGAEPISLGSTGNLAVAGMFLTRGYSAPAGMMVGAGTNYFADALVAESFINATGAVNFVHHTNAVTGTNFFFSITITNAVGGRGLSFPAWNWYTDMPTGVTNKGRVVLMAAGPSTNDVFASFIQVK